MSIKEKIQQRLDKLEEMMDNGSHLHASDKVSEQIESISKFWSVLDDSEKEYIQCARHALENQKEWK